MYHTAKNAGTMGFSDKEKKDRQKFLIKLGIHISQIRSEKNISVSELARLCFMDKPNLIRIEKGRVNSSIFILKRIADALEISLQSLFDGLE